MPLHTGNPTPFGNPSPQEISFSEEDQVPRVRERQQLLSDKKGILYFGPAEVIQKFLAVEKYQERWPLVPAAELHASSVRHPMHPEYRWLLHSRRVPVLSEAISGESGGDLPRCSGVGDPDRTVLLCPWCARSLCHRKPTLPPRALANDMWGGLCINGCGLCQPQKCCWVKGGSCTAKWCSIRSMAERHWKHSMVCKGTRPSLLSQKPLPSRKYCHLP